MSRLPSSRRARASRRAAPDPRDFALLWVGRGTSLLGDGVYVVAVAWLVFSITNTPTALAVVGVALSVPQVGLFLLGGVLTDRLERRRMLLAADALRGAAVAAMGLLAVTGALELWHLAALVALVGAGDALFNPAFAAIVPDLVPRERLERANALEQLMRPLALRLVGPPLGGLLVAVAGAGEALLVDAATFGVSTVALVAMRRGPAPAREKRTSMRADVAEAWTYLRTERWLWAGLTAGAISLLAFWGPFEVLLPYVVKNDLGGGAAGFGLVLAAGGAGAVATSLAVGRRGLPFRRRYRGVFACFTLMTASVGAYGVVAATWQAAVVYMVAASLNALLMVGWSTLLQSHVPRALLGRVASLDWMVSFGLIPVSFALTGPLAGAFGARATLIGAGLLGGSASVTVWVLARLHTVDAELERRAPSSVAVRPAGGRAVAA
jgi:hypothetical protein